MKLGLVTDIHEQVDPLRAALDHFRRQHVDQIAMIGDVFEMGEHIRETCQLLADNEVVGVWCERRSKAVALGSEIRVGS